MSPERAEVTYEQFGRHFFQTAVTGERMVGTVNALAGEPIRLGPIGVGPGRIAKVTAHGEIGEASYTLLPGNLVRARVTLPVQLAFEVDLQVDTHRFTADLALPLVLTARAVEGLAVWVDIDPPRPDEIGIDLQATSLRAGLLQRVAGVEAEVRRFVSVYVEREIEKPYVRAARMIDIAGAIDLAWEQMIQLPKEAATQVATDFAEAIEQEIRDSNRLFGG